MATTAGYIARTRIFRVYTDDGIRLIGALAAAGDESGASEKIRVRKRGHVIEIAGGIELDRTPLNTAPYTKPNLCTSRPFSRFGNNLTGLCVGRINRRTRGRTRASHCRMRRTKGVALSVFCFIAPDGSRWSGPGRGAAISGQGSE
jgi:hypothetical protein